MAAVAVLAVAVTAVAAPVRAEEDEFVRGSGEVEARLVRMGPSAGRLSFAPSVGLTVANYTNTVGRAISRYFDFAALDDSIPPEIRDRAPVVRVDSTDEGAEEGRTVTSGGTPEGSPVRAGGTTQRAKAGAAPFGEAEFILGDFAPVPGQVELVGGRAWTRAGVVDGDARVAHGVVRYERIVLGAGALELRGATWQAVQRTGADATASGSFRVRSVVAGDRQLRPPDELDAPERWAQLNDAIEPLGIRLDPPRVEIEQGVVETTPLGIRVFASAVGRGAGPPLVDGLQPVREEVAGRMIEREPEAGSLLTLGDLALGALVGTGVVDVQLGGTTAFTEGEAFDDPFGSFDLSAPPPTAGGVGRASGSSGAGGAAASLGPTVGDGPAGLDPTAGEGSAADVALAGSRRVPGTRGGAAAVVGVLGLVAVLGMAGADWWRLRREPRRITP